MSRITTNDKSFALQPDETLLEALERTGHEVEYQCRSGYCGACRLHLLEGRVDYAELPLAFLAPGDILPCCCRVHGDVRIDCNLRADALQPNHPLFEPGLFDEV